MSGVTVTLKRVNQKGYICFEAPAEVELQEALKKVLRLCRDKNNDYVSVTLPDHTDREQQDRTARITT